MAIDHIVYAVHDLEQGMAFMEQQTGIKPKIGGQHQGLGTWNALLSLGPEMYLEILAPDPSQGIQPAWLGLDDLKHPRITRWAAKSNDLRNLTSFALQQNIEIGKVLPFNRKTPDGLLLSWELTDPKANAGDGLIPFFIDWQDTKHPETSLEKGCQIKELKAFHPNASFIKEMLLALEIELTVVEGPSPKIELTLNTPKGIIKLT